MVGSNMFSFINQKLQEISCIKQPFGGINMLLFGDLFQIHPVSPPWSLKKMDLSKSKHLIFWRIMWKYLEKVQVLCTRWNYEAKIWFNICRNLK